MSLSSRPGHHGPKKLQQGCVPTSSLSSPPRPSGPPLACTPPSAQVTFTLLPPVGPSLPRTQREGRGSAGGHRCPAPGAWPRWAAAPVRPGAVAVSRRPRTYCRCLESAARASACAGTAGSAGSCPSGRSPRTRGQIPRSSPACSLGGADRRTDRCVGGRKGRGSPPHTHPRGWGKSEARGASSRVPTAPESAVRGRRGACSLSCLCLLAGILRTTLLMTRCRWLRRMKGGGAGGRLWYSSMRSCRWNFQIWSVCSCTCWNV